jgi:DNA repair exonuclease SbcCD ATPase subunit
MNKDQKIENKNPLSLNEFSNKKVLISNNYDNHKKTYNYTLDKVNNNNDSQGYHCQSEENFFPVQKSPSVESMTEDDFNNTYNKKFYETNISNGMKINKNKQNYVGQPPLYSELLSNKYNNNLNLNKPNVNYLDYKLAQLNSELIALNSDNLMLKEDIYKYTDINKYLENEIKIQKEHNIDLLNTNNHLIEDHNDLNDKLINDTNEFNELIQDKENKQNEYDEKQKNLELKNNKISNDYDELISINNKTKNDYNRLCQNYDELNKNNDCVKNEICLLKEIQSKHFADIEEKINNIITQIDKLKKEQISLNKENIENKNKLQQVKNEKENYFKKYQDEMLLNEQLTKELYNNKLNLDTLKKKYYEKDKKKYKKFQKRPCSLNKKKELIKDLQKKLDDYKIRHLKYSYIDDDY